MKMTADTMKITMAARWCGLKNSLMKQPPIHKTHEIDEGDDDDNSSCDLPAWGFQVFGLFRYDTDAHTTAQDEKDIIGGNIK
jgi:hypothetical protein